MFTVKVLDDAQKLSEISGCRLDVAQRYAGQVFEGFHQDTEYLRYTNHYMGEAFGTQVVFKIGELEWVEAQ